MSSKKEEALKTTKQLADEHHRLFISQMEEKEKEQESRKKEALDIAQNDQ